MRPKPRILIALALAAGAAATVIALGGSLAVAEPPDLETRIDSARDEASLITNRINEQGARVAELEAKADEAAAREQELLAELEERTARSKALNDDLLAAEDELTAVRARYKRSVDVLADRLVAIYKGAEPDALTVVLEADGFDELETHAEYLEALTDADERIADRVADLRDQVQATYESIAGLKASIDAEARELEAARTEIIEVRAEAKRDAEDAAAARADGEAALRELQDKISGWELEVRREAAREVAEGGGEAFLGGPYSIPTYIVMCESGGNYRALNRSSMAGGAYQIIPSTWQAYGGKGQYAHLASKAEQDRIAAIIWREDGPGAWSCA